MKIVYSFLFVCVMYISVDFLQAMEYGRDISINQGRLLIRYPHVIHNHDVAIDDLDEEVDSQAPTELTTPRNIYQEDDEVSTLLYEAVCLGNIETVKWLLQQHVSLSCSALYGADLEDMTNNEEIKSLIKNTRDNREMVKDLFAASFRQ